MYKKLILLFVSCLLTGCVTIPAPPNQPKAAASVGDYGSTQLSEIVVSVPISDIANLYQNLHVRFAALINLRKITLTSINDIENIVRRSNARLSSVIVNEICAQGVISAKVFSSLPGLLTAKAQQSFNTFYNQWEHADEFKIEIVITSIYLTETSISPTPNQSRFWID